MPVISLIAFVVYGSSMAFVLAALRRGDVRLPGEGRSPARRVALAGLLAALTALMQGSATFWPGVGHLLATLSTLPVAVGTLAAPQSAVALVLAAAGTLALVHGHQAVVFLRGFFCRRAIGFRLAEKPPGLLPGRGEAVDGEKGQGPGHDQDEAQG